MRWKLDTFIISMRKNKCERSAPWRGLLRTFFHAKVVQNPHRKKSYTI